MSLYQRWTLRLGSCEADSCFGVLDGWCEAASNAHKVQCHWPEVWVVAFCTNPFQLHSFVTTPLLRNLRAFCCGALKSHAVGVHACCVGGLGRWLPATPNQHIKHTHVHHMTGPVVSPSVHPTLPRLLYAVFGTLLAGSCTVAYVQCLAASLVGLRA